MNEQSDGKGALLEGLKIDRKPGASRRSMFLPVTLSFIVGGLLVLQGILFALAVGFIGGFFPALRAARLPLVAAFRDIQAQAKRRGVWSH